MSLFDGTLYAINTLFITKKAFETKKGEYRMKKRINKANVIIVIMALVFIAVIALSYEIEMTIHDHQKGRKAYRFTEKTTDEMFPYDETEAEYINNSAPYKEGETWAIYQYLVASNLELSGHNQLSSYVEYIAGEETKARTDAEEEHTKELLDDFMMTEDENNIPMPISFYDADYDRATEDVVPEEKHEVSSLAWGSDILDVFRQAELPDNVTYVVQAGGAKAWKDSQVNPNRTRRFVKKGNELVEVYDAPVVSMGESETLTDFLNFCKENYPADHTMVILTDHGGAFKGFGWDEVYTDDGLSLRELTEGFDNAYDLNEEEPPIDLIYFNACLMSNTDVSNAMRGVCKYMIAGEEVGLSMSAYYSEVAKALCDRPNMNAMQLGKTLIDCYAADLTEYAGKFGAPPSTGLGLLDMKKAPKVYDEYADFAGKVLADVADNPELLSRLSRNVSESVSLAVNHYKSYNLTDLGLWAQCMDDLYPEETKSIIESIDDAVIYKRVDGYLQDAHGISVYYPNYVESLRSIKLTLNYIDNISYSDDISALYYYKLAGSLNDKYKEYCIENGIKVPEAINYGAMSLLRNSSVTPIDDMGNVKATIDEEVYPILTDVRYELAKVENLTNKITYFGEDRFVMSDGGNGIQTVFEGNWVKIGGTPFYLNVINTYENTFIYESPVKYQGYEYKLMIQCDVDEEAGIDTFTILGLRHPDDEAATIDRNVVALKPGSYITPIYYESDVKGGQITKTEGSSVLYNINTRIQDEKLEKGQYRARIVYEDMRGEDVYSEPVFFDVK